MSAPTRSVLRPLVSVSSCSSSCSSPSAAISCRKTARSRL
jgi:hypothetical protein